jgi:hypothetical protein
MNTGLMLVSAVLGLGMLGGCDRMNEPNKPKVGVASEMRSPAPPFPSSVPTPSVMNQAPPQSPPTAAERKDGAPIQGQVDPKEPAQRKDFEDKKR